MMKICLAISILLFSWSSMAQLSRKEIMEHRDTHKTELLDTAFHMMNQEEIDEFGGLDYFNFDSMFKN